MKDGKMKATATEKAQVVKDYGAARHWGEKTQDKVEVRAVGRGWDGNKGSEERTDKVPERAMPWGIVE